MFLTSRVYSNLFIYFMILFNTIYEPTSKYLLVYLLTIIFRFSGIMIILNNLLPKNIVIILKAAK